MAVDDSLSPKARIVLDAASRLFYERGITAVGVDTIAEESGVTKRTLYDRFGSKDALVEAYLNRRQERWWARLDELLAEAPSPRVLAVFDAYIGNPDAQAPTRGCAFINAAAELPSQAPAMTVVSEHKRKVQARVVELVAEHVQDHVLAERTARHIFLLLEGAIVHRGLDGDDHALHEARDIAAEVLAAQAG